MNTLIRALVITAGVLCADETPIRVGPGAENPPRYLLVACTSLLTYFFLGDRSMGTFDAFVFPDLSGTVLVHDRYQNYDAIPGVLTSCAPSTSSAILRTPPSRTRTRSGRARQRTRSAPSSTPATLPGARDSQLSPTMKWQGTCASSAAPSLSACRRSAGSPARKRSRNQAACCWNA